MATSNLLFRDNKLDATATPAAPPPIITTSWWITLALFACVPTMRWVNPDKSKPACLPASKVCARPRLAPSLKAHSEAARMPERQ